jgi:argininosuccinate lyase
MANENTPGSLWGSRFSGSQAESAAALGRSTHFDWRLASFDIAGSKAHVKALFSAGYLNNDEAERLTKVLNQLLERVQSGSFAPKPQDEDVHSALERGLIEIAGAELGGKLRAGRSRNDQIATLIRMYLMAESTVIEKLVLELIAVLIARAEEHLGSSIPGRTHMQHAQPVLLSHHLLAHVWPLTRDLDRLRQWRSRANLSPYGAGALAGSSLGLDPQLVATELGFAGTTQNSIDGTASRDVVAEFAFILSMISINLSRFAEEIIIWATEEFGYIKIDDAYSTGSSIMPQKKNPDVAELARGKSGRLIGNLAGLLATFKALPLAYNRDLQEDKEPVMDSIDTLALLLPAFTGMVATMKFDLDRMELLSSSGFSLATDVAEWLVKKQVPFREAHEITGKLVAFCEQNGLELHQVPDVELSKISKSLTGELREVLSVSGSIKSRSAVGGTSLPRVLEQISELKRSWSKIS